MKLSDCKMGEIVCMNDEDEFYQKPIGHIVGLTRVFYTSPKLGKTYYVAPIVKFADQEPMTVHADLLEKLD